MLISLYYMVNFSLRPRVEVSGQKYTPKQLAELFFTKMGHEEAMEGIRVGRIHPRGSRRTIRIYRSNADEGEVLIAKIRIIANGASYTGLSPLEYSAGGEHSPDDATKTYFIGDDYRDHFSQLRISSGLGYGYEGVPEEEPYTNFDEFVDLKELNLEKRIADRRN